MAANPSVGVAVDQGRAFPQTVEGGDDGGGLGHQPHGLAMVGLGRHVLRLGIVQAEHGDGGAQHVHGVGLGNAAQEIHHLRPAARAAATRSFFRLSSSACFGQPAVPKEENHLLENSVIRQRVDVIAAVAENAQISVDVTDLRFARDDAFETSHCRSHNSLLVFVFIVERDGAPKSGGSENYLYVRPCS